MLAGHAFTLSRERALEVSVLPQHFTLQRLREVGEKVGKRFPGSTRMGMGWGKVREHHDASTVFRAQISKFPE